MFLEIIIVWVTIGLAAYVFAMFDLRKYFTSQDDEEEERTRLLTAERIPEQEPVLSSSYWYTDVDRIEIFFQSTNKDVRNFINEFVCNEIGDINTTPIHQLYNHPKYETVFRKFHSQLKSTLVLLESRLSSAQSDHKNEDSITDSETGLKELQELISTINYYVMDHLPNFPNTCKSTPRTTSYAMLIPSYEDLLSTSILNRIILSSQEQQRNASHSPDSAVQTGSDFNTEDSSDQNSIQTDKVEQWVTSTTTAAGKTITSSDDDDISEGSNSTPDEKVKKTNNRIVIEEHIEEIIINSYQNDDEEPLNQEEMGIMNEEDGVGELEDENDSNDQSWEDNWLFKKKKHALKNSGNQKQPVSMFIPNPITVQLPSNEAEPELEENEDVEVPVPVLSSEDETEDRNFEAQMINPHIITVEIHSSPQINESSQVAGEDEHPPYSLESTHETLRETSQSLIASNDTLEIEAKVETLAETPIFAHEVSMESATTVVTSYQSVTVTKETEPPVPFEKLETESPVSSEDLAQIQPPLPMRIAEREKQKWNNPVKITNNPYAPENLTKRINNNISLKYGDKPVEAKVTPEIEFAERSLPSSLNKINRDYYVNSENSSLPPERNFRNSVSKELPSLPAKEIMIAMQESEPAVKMNALNDSSRSSSSSDLNEIKLPSVKNLAMMFSDSSKGEAKLTPIKRVPPRRVFETKPAAKEILPVLQDKTDPTRIPFEFVEIPNPDPSIEEKSSLIPSDNICNTTEVGIESQPTTEPDSSVKSRTETPLEVDSNDDPISVENSTYVSGTEDEVATHVHNPEPEVKTPILPESSGIRSSSGARAVIARLEKLNQNVIKKPVALPRGNYMKEKYGLDTDEEMKSPMRAMEFFASQEIRKATPVEPDEDLRRLRRNILREMRTSKGASGKFDE